MQVETFEIEEQDETMAPEAIEEEAKALAAEMGLVGQQTLTHKSADGTAERIPYPKMDTERGVVYKTLFPVETMLEKYDAGIVPLRVLQVAKHAQSLGLVLFVWHSQVYNPDPVLVGKRAGTQDVFLLARWGSALASYAQLLEHAKKRIKESLERAAKDTVARGKAVLADLEAHVDKKLCGEWFYL